MKARGIFVSLLISLTCALIFLSGCTPGGWGPVPQPPSSVKSITAFSLNGVAGTINETEKTIAVAMPFGTDVTALVATFTTTGASVKVGSTDQISGTTANNFTSPVTYTVTAADSSTQDYTVVVTVASSSAKAITAFILNGVVGTINETGKTIAVTMPFGTSVTNLMATFTTTGISVKVGSTVQINGTMANNFTSPVTYTVTAADSSTQDYTVVVTVASSSAKAITAFSLNGSVGTINETNKTITVTMPFGTYIMDLVATFTTTGASVKVGSTVQVSGTTAHNFTSPVTYTVTAADGTTVDYTVTVTFNRTWHNPASLSDHISPEGQNALCPEVAMDNNGNAIIVWYQSDGNHYQIFKSEYRNGVWTNPSSLADNISPEGQDAIYPQVAMDNSGNAIITWEQNDGTNYQIFKSEYRNGIWTNPSSLSDHISPEGQHALCPEVAMDNNGNAIIVWYQSDGNHYQIFKSEYRNGIWTNPSSLTDNISLDGQNAFLPEVAMENNGNAIITWEQNDGTNYQIFKSEYRNGIWTNPSSLADNISPNGQDAFRPEVAMENNGNAIITWDQNNGTNYQIFKSEYRNGIWTNPSSLADNISPDGQDASYPEVAMDNSGNAIITWFQSDGANYQIFKSECRNGVWTNPSSLSDNISPDGQNAFRPEVAMENNGNAIITWDQNDGTNYQIFKSEYRNGIWTSPSSLTDNISLDGQNSAYPQVAVDNNGNAVIVWFQYDGPNMQIFKSEYR